MTLAIEGCVRLSGEMMEMMVRPREGLPREGDSRRKEKMGAEG